MNGPMTPVAAPVTMLMTPFAPICTGVLVAAVSPLETTRIGPAAPGVETIEPATGVYVCVVAVVVSEAISGT